MGILASEITQPYTCVSLKTVIYPCVSALGDTPMDAISIPHDVPDNERGAFDITTFCLAYKLSRSMVYREIKDGRLRVMKVGNRTLISRRAARDYERLCEQTQV
jgi:hypothetical protein